MGKKDQFILVMIRNTDIVPLGEWGMDRGYSIDYLGAAEALRKAQEYIEHCTPLFTNIEFKLEGGEI